LLGGPLKNAQDLDAKYLLELESDRPIGIGEVTPAASDGDAAKNPLTGYGMQDTNSPSAFWIHYPI
jgi:hypothetical protein